MTSITRQKSEHKKAILDNLRSYISRYPERLENLIISLGTISTRKMTLAELSEWRKYLDFLLAKEE